MNDGIELPHHVPLQRTLRNITERLARELAQPTPLAASRPLRVEMLHGVRLALAQLS